MRQDLHRGVASAQHRRLDGPINASWEDLHTFLLCTRHQSFRHAAEALGLTGTTLMRKIDRLEEELGVKLFIRDQSGLSLSDEGRALLFDVEQMEQLSFNILRRASLSTETRGTVRVAVTEGPGNFWILPRLIDFQKTYRKVTVDLRCAMEQADVSRLEADISIQFERPTNPDQIVTRLGRLHIYTFASEAYRDTYGLPQSLQDLRNHRIIKQHGVQLDETGYARARRSHSARRSSRSISVSITTWICG
jgi:DNA-binding transcriptional LysR family regulator